jgi:hypothetical protein
VRETTGYEPDIERQQATSPCETAGYDPVRETTGNKPPERESKKATIP